MGTYNSNQFRITDEVGTLDLTVGGLSPAFTVRFSPESTVTDGIEAGQAVKLVDLADKDFGTVPLVDVATGTDVAFGARLFMPKTGKSMPGEIIQISSDGCVQVMEAGDALTRGTVVSFDPATPGRVAEQGANAQFGILLDRAKAEGDIVRVLIKPVKTA